MRNGHVGWVLGGFGGSGGSVWVMGEWAVGQWIVGVMGFQAMYGLKLKQIVPRKYVQYTGWFF